MVTAAGYMVTCLVYSASGVINQAELQSGCNGSTYTVQRGVAAYRRVLRTTRLGYA